MRMRVAKVPKRIASTARFCLFEIGSKRKMNSINAGPLFGLDIEVHSNRIRAVMPRIFTIESNEYSSILLVNACFK